MTTSKQTSIVVATRNRVAELTRTLDSLELLTPEALSILLFDDSSSDGTTDVVKSRYPDATLTTSVERVGYIEARNRLLDRVPGEYAVSLDDDAELISPAAIRIVERTFQSYPRCGVLAFRIYWGSELSPAHSVHDEPARRVRSFVGCGHAWRLAAWRAVRPYPSWYRFYGEETYASLALAREGWEVRSCPDVLVHHRVDPAARPGNERWQRYRLQLRADLLNILTYYPRSSVSRHVGHAIRTQLARARSGPSRRAWELFRTLSGLLVELPRWARHRRPLDAATWQRWISLPPPTVFWQPTDRRIRNAS